MKRIFAMMLVLSMLCCTLCSCYYDEKLHQAKKLFKKADYEGVVSMLENDYEITHSEDGKQYFNYAQAMIALENGYVKFAQELLLEIEGFEDTSEKLLEIERFLSQIKGTYHCYRENSDDYYAVELDGTTVGIGLVVEDSGSNMSDAYQIICKDMDISGPIHFSISGLTFDYSEEARIEYDVTIDGLGENLFLSQGKDNDSDVYCGTYEKQ